MQSHSLPLSVCTAGHVQAARQLADHLGLPTIDAMPASFKGVMVLSWFQDKKQPPEAPKKLGLFSEFSGPVSIDFTAGKKAHRRQFGGGKGQPLARAIGLKGDSAPTLLDATAGMGGDAFVFATLGCHVTLVERSPIVAALLNDALERARNDPQTDPELKTILDRMHLVNADAADYLLTEQPAVDVIYLDPMYPEKKKSASAKKEMKVLQALLGPDMDSEKLLDAALHTAQSRVVVKRPAKAPAIEGTQPNAEVKSPNTRYDLYSIKALKAAGKL